MRRRGEASASARAGGGAPAPVKKSKTPLVALNDLLSGKPRCSRWPGLLLSQEVPMKRLRDVGGVLVLAAAIFGPTLVAGQQPPAGQPPAGGFPDLVGALKATPGCLGVETARTSSGKQVIFAWFENKKAVLNWYYSDTHRSVQKMFAPGSRRWPAGAGDRVADAVTRARERRHAVRRVADRDRAVPSAARRSRGGRPILAVGDESPGTRGRADAHAAEEPAVTSGPYPLKEY